MKFKQVNVSKLGVDNCFIQINEIIALGDEEKIAAGVLLCQISFSALR
jgi:hypothetical protein